MGRFLTKRMLLVLTSILLLHLFISSSYGASFNSNVTGTCIPEAGRLHPYVSEGKKTLECSYLELKDLNQCKLFHEKTYCSTSQLNSISLSLGSLSTYGEAVKDCLDLFELLECSICHPGIQSRSLRICASFCDRVFEACSEAYFSSDIINQVIVPCGSSKDIICGKASKWVCNGTEFCNAVGFPVQEADDSVEEPCYGSKSSVEPMVSDDSIEEPCFGNKSSLEPMVEQESIIKTEKFEWFQDLQKRVKMMTLAHKISWVVTVFVLGLKVFYRWSYMNQMRAMIERNVRR